MRRIFTIILLAILVFPNIAMAATEYKIDDVFRKLYPRPEWYIKLTTEDGNWTFCYDILTDEIEPGHVYTIDEMLVSDCQAYDNWERESHKFVTATYCETFSPEGALMIEATATTTDGMDVVLHYGIDPLPEPIDFIEFTTSDVELEDLTSRGAAMFVGQTKDYVISVGLKCTDIPGEYTMDHSSSIEGGSAMSKILYDSFCYIEPKGGEIIPILDGHATVTATERGYNVEAQFLGQDACMYNIHLTYEIPEPIETRIIRCDNLVVNTTYAAQFGETIFEASNEDWELELWVNTDKPLGYFSGNIIDASYSVLINRHTKEMLSLYYAEFVVGTDENNIFLRGGMMARDKNYYILELTAPLTVDTRSVTLDIPNASYFDNTENGVLQFYGDSEDGSQHVSIALKTYNIETASYDRSQTHRDYTYVQEHVTHAAEGESGIIFYEPYIATINVIPQTDGTIDVEAYLRCDNLVDDTDHPLYIVRMHCTKDGEAQLGMKFDAQNLDYEAHIPSSGLTLDDQFLADGYVYLDGYDPDTRASISLEFNIAALDPEIGIPAGIYPINDSWQPGTLSISRGVQDGIVWPSYAAYGEADGSLDIPVWLLQSGSATVSNVDGRLYVELEGQNSCNRTVRLTLGDEAAAISPLLIQRTTRPVKMLRHGQLLIKNGSRLYDALGRSKSSILR